MKKEYDHTTKGFPTKDDWRQKVMKQMMDDGLLEVKNNKLEITDKLMSTTPQ